MDGEAHTIADGLPVAQREMLVRHRPHFGSATAGWPGSGRDPRSFTRAGRPLMDAGLIRWVNDPRSSKTTLTDLGKAVRAHLLGERKDG